jgi:hypothetical protein
VADVQGLAPDAVAAVMRSGLLVIISSPETNRLLSALSSLQCAQLTGESPMSSDEQAIELQNVAPRLRIRV